MSFLQSEYLIPVIVFLALLIYLSVNQEIKFFQWIKDHWFLKRSGKNIIGSILYYLGLLLICLALLDLRGQETNIAGKISDQKTILLIDSSASMLTEDVRPNRFQKALLLAKHYVRKAVGQQVSVVVFSDSSKQIIPFTNDMDLVDARLSALEDMKLERGGTSLSLAIQESIQYFKNNSESISGNILMFTDAEETEGGISTEIPDSISVGVIGVGTAKGGPIPIRDSRGVFKGNKKFNGETVISKLDENFLKSFGAKVKDFRYWIATSYSIPTEEIISFFTKIHKIKQSKNNFRIRPVLSNYLMVPGVILLIFSFVFKSMNSFVYIALLFISLSGYTQDNKEDKMPEKSKVVLELEQKFSEGKITEIEKKTLASYLLKEGFPEQAETLYKEIIKAPVNKDNLKDKFNLGASEFKNKKIKEGFDTYKEIHDYLKRNDPGNELLPSVKENMLKAIEQMSSQSKSKKSDEKDKDENKDKKDESGKGDEGKEGKDSEQKENKDQKDKEGKNDKKDQKDKDKDKDKKGDEKKKNKDDNESKEKDKKDKQKNKNKNGEGDKPQSKKKMPAILKQLMSDDNQLQKKMIDTGTTKRKTREKRDW